MDKTTGKPVRVAALALGAILAAPGCARDGESGPTSPSATAAAPETPATAPATAATKPAARTWIWNAETGLVWKGRAITSYPVHEDATKLTDLWEEVPPGSKSYEIRKDVRAVRSSVEVFAVIYVLPGGQRFYVERSPVGSSRHHFYGPFEGDPSPLIGEDPATVKP